MYLSKIALVLIILVAATIGATLGVFVMAACVAAGRADDAMERLQQEERKLSSGEK